MTARVYGKMAVAALGGLGAVLLAGGPVRASTVWQTAGTGDWGQGDNWSAGVPDTADVAFFNQVDATVDISGSAVARSLYFQHGHTTTLQLEDGASLDASVDQSYIGESGDTVGSHVIFLGPQNTDATVKTGRFNIPYVPHSLVFSGEHLKVTIADDSFTSISGGGSTLTIKDGASVVGTHAGSVGSTYWGGQFYIRPSSRLTVENGSLSGGFISLDAGVPGGLLQLADQGTLKAGGVDQDNNTVTTLAISVASGGRFEAEGTGLDASVAPTIKSGGTLAVGVNPVGGEQSTAKTLTLHGMVTVNNGGALEMSLFGDGSNDQIAFAAGGKLANGTGSGTVLQLVLGGGYRPQIGDSWALFSGATGSNLTGHFDTSQIDLSKYSLDQFNQAGGWIITAVPEPAGLGWLAVAAGGLLLRRRAGRGESRRRGQSAG